MYYNYNYTSMGKDSQMLVDTQVNYIFFRDNHTFTNM